MDTKQLPNPWHVFQMTVGAFAIILIAYFGLLARNDSFAQVSSDDADTSTWTDKDFETYLQYEFQYLLDTNSEDIYEAEQQSRVQFANELSTAIDDDLIQSILNDDSKTSEEIINEANPNVWERISNFFKNLFSGQSASAAEGELQALYNRISEAEKAYKKASEHYEQIVKEIYSSGKKITALNIKTLELLKKKKVDAEKALDAAKDALKNWRERQKRNHKSAASSGSRNSRDRRGAYNKARERQNRRPTYEEWLEELKNGGAIFGPLEPTTPEIPSPGPQPLPTNPGLPGIEPLDDSSPSFSPQVPGFNM